MLRKARYRVFPRSSAHARGVLLLGEIIILLGGDESRDSRPRGLRNVKVKGTNGTNEINGTNATNEINGTNGINGTEMVDLPIFEKLGSK